MGRGTAAVRAVVSMVACAATASCASDASEPQPPHSFVPTPSAVVPPRLTPRASLPWQPCIETWTDSSAPPPPSVECTTLEVPRDYAHQLAPAFRLRLARRRAEQPTSRAVFFLAGGPGASAVQLSASMAEGFESLRQTVDLLWLDQRGTGGSEYLDCHSTSAWGVTLLHQCQQQLSTLDLDPFLTLASARDLDTVRSKLGYEKVFLWGGSYGSRLALEYIRQFHQHVAAAMLMQIVPPDYDQFGELVRAFDRSVELLARDCHAAPACRAITDDVTADLRERGARLLQAPRHILVDGESRLEDEPTYRDLLKRVVQQPQLRFGVPRAIRLSLLGEHQSWDQLASRATGQVIVDASDATPPADAPPALSVLGHGIQQQALSLGLFSTISCTEFLPNAGGVGSLRALTEQQSWGNDLTSNEAPVRLAEACEQWAPAQQDPSLRQPVIADVPVLLLSGGLDLATPPAWGEHAAATLSRSRHIVVPYAGHGLPETCTRPLATAFFEAEGAPDRLDISCLFEAVAPSW